MSRQRLLMTLSSACLFCILTSAITASASEHNRLGTDLTPLGAEAKGNAAGSIPAWNGGINKAPSGFKEGDHYIDPYADDKPLFTINSKNAEQYKDNLTPGQLALLKKYPTYKLLIYPTRRSASLPPTLYEKSLLNAKNAKLAKDGNTVSAAAGGAPFPMPANGTELIWNHLLRYRGDGYETVLGQAVVNPNGSYTLIKFEYKVLNVYGNQSLPASVTNSGKLLDVFQTIVSPPPMAGTILLVYDYLDAVADPRKIWIYSPGQRRVSLAPLIGYDAPGTAADGLRTSDDLSMFNGAIDRYNWTLIGKREIFIPYNAYKLNSKNYRYADILQPLHINQEIPRYELHRVWVIEANLKPGKSHVYPRRTFYLDEDSWTIALSEAYDKDGQLWRVGEYHLMNYYDVPAVDGSLELRYDLKADRYLAVGLRNEERYFRKNPKYTEQDFTLETLRAMGTR